MLQYRDCRLRGAPDGLRRLPLLGKLQPQRALDVIIAEMSQQARERGLTPEPLEDLLRDVAG